MKFIKDHQSNTAQLRVTLDHPRQHAFGNYFQTGIWPDAVLRTHPVANGIAWLFVKQLRQPLRDVTRRQTTRLQQDNFPVNAGMRQQLQRQPG
ncbi:Uncharacterised protein [Shigella sonnei]|nr:Uncharacterised protein [Shigella sonnei]CSQ75270.1 Uncharacterised protein [Shigella sonnei]CSQ79443.1 Uncharacterised protein [Shigella sonnei]